MSACAGSVGKPVDGPPRCTSTNNAKAFPSCGVADVFHHQREAGPEVTVKAWRPPQTAPCNVIEAASSSSIWMKVPPTVGTREAKRSTTSVEGVMGYPAAKRAPAANAPSQQAVIAIDEVCAGPVSARIGLAMIGFHLSLPCPEPTLWRLNCEIGAVHAAEVTSAALFGMTACADGSPWN